MILKTENLMKYFGSYCAVKSVSMEVQEKDIYGFLGLNGAGKTTTIRMVLQLIKASGGKILVFGKPVRGRHKEVMSQIGALVEQPVYYKHLTAEQNLEVLRLISRDTPKSRIPEVLEQVGLSRYHKGKVGTFSQGMRQRLGIAMALLARPRFVILDEPTNGLDPQGIIDIRNVILELNKSGVTFLISSHLLHEIELTCNRVGIIVQGDLILQEEVHVILEKATTGCEVRVNPINHAKELISKMDYIKKFSVNGERIRVELPSLYFSRLNRELNQNGVQVSELIPTRLSLEEFFLITQKRETKQG